MKNMKFHTPMILCFLLLMANLVNAQPPDKKPLTKEKREKIEQLKIAFITKELDLTTEEAEKFWPIYNEMTEKMLDKKKESRKLNKELRENFDTLSEAEIQTKTEAILNKDIEQAKLKKEYTAKIAEVIGYKKATKLLSLEQRFKRELLERVNRPEHRPVDHKPAPRQEN